MRLPFTPFGATDLIVSSILCVGAIVAGVIYAPEHPWLWAVVGLAAAVWALLLNFFRDPERETPKGPLLIVSPADGIVKDIGELPDPGHLGDTADRIGIFLSPLDVHVNRMPMDCTVVAVDYKRGQMLPAYEPRAIEVNESCATVIEVLGGKCRLVVRQVTGAVARRIVCPVKPGERFQAGQRYGMIKFGSRTEVWVPKRMKVRWNVKLGDRVWCGVTVLGTLTDDGSAGA